jgi:L-alanine-DL-glutamate epimerase-like enolase superfamily enzyme
MKIKSFDVFGYKLVYVRGVYALSGGRVQTHQTALVVRINTDEGITGWGETCPLGRTHLPAYFESEREALAIVGQSVIGLDPRDIGLVQSAMARALLSGMAAKSAIDVACWDIMGKAAGLPLSSLLGGRQQERVRVWDSIPLLPPDEIGAWVKDALSRGALDFQVKVGDDPYEDANRVAAVMACVKTDNLVVADANGGWNIQNALIAAREMASFRIHLEQPCKSVANCAEVRRRSSLPIIVDECVGNVDDLIIAQTQIHAGGVNVKPSRLGGITPARLIRDIATELGMMVIVDDCWGGAITTAVLGHLAVSTKPSALLATTFFTDITTPLIADAPRRGPDGYGTVSMRPGLGIEVDVDRLGDPIFSIRDK